MSSICGAFQWSNTSCTDPRQSTCEGTDRCCPAECRGLKLSSSRPSRVAFTVSALAAPARVHCCRVPSVIKTPERMARRLISHGARAAPLPR